jgi:hypothetical protein
MPSTNRSIDCSLMCSRIRSNALPISTKVIGIAEFQCLLWQKAIKHAIEAIPKIGQSFWALNDAIPDHIKHINPGSESFCQDPA